MWKGTINWEPLSICLIRIWTKNEGGGINIFFEFNKHIQVYVEGNWKVIFEFFLNRKQTFNNIMIPKNVIPF